MSLICSVRTVLKISNMIKYALLFSINVSLYSFQENSKNNYVLSIFKTFTLRAKSIDIKHTNTYQQRQRQNLAQFHISTYRNIHWNSGSQWRCLWYWSWGRKFSLELVDLYTTQYLASLDFGVPKVSNFCNNFRIDICNNFKAPPHILSGPAVSPRMENQSTRLTVLTSNLIPYL